jgi:hypothetical protein
MQRTALRAAADAGRYVASLRWSDMNKFFSLIFLCALLSFAAATVAQDRVTLSTKVREAINKREPKWKLVRDNEIDDPGKVGNPAMVWLQWEQNGGRIDANMILLRDEAQASQWMGYFMKKAHQRCELEQLGQPNFIESTSGAGAFIIFQRGRTLFTVFSSSKELAIRFARMISAVAI